MLRLFAVLFISSSNISEIAMSRSVPIRLIIGTETIIPVTAEEESAAASASLLTENFKGSRLLTP